MRKHYNNGDEITMSSVGCDGCQPAIVNGTMCHEQGCPEAWRDYARECPWCGALFHATDKSQQVCCSDSCIESYFG